MDSFNVGDCENDDVKEVVCDCYCLEFDLEDFVLCYSVVDKEFFKVLCKKDVCVSFDKDCNVVICVMFDVYSR